MLRQPHAELQELSTLLQRSDPIRNTQQYAELQELSKVNEFEDMFNSASQQAASKFGMPAITLDELPPTIDPMGEYTISAEEVKWIIKAAKESAEHIKKTDPRFADPYNSEEFKQEQARVAEKLGIGPEKLAQLQKEMTTEKWKALHG